ncbi:MAG: ABC transporter ATP-binding protein [Thermomicrobiales bacterium]
MDSVSTGSLAGPAGTPQRFRFEPGARTATMRDAAVRAEEVRKVYGRGDTRVEALRGIDVGFGSGQLTAIMGPSGSGKSTLMHCLAGLDTVSGGKVFLGDTDLTSLDDTALTVLRRERIGFVFQSFNLLPAFTAEQNIRMPLMLAGKRGLDRDWFGVLVQTLGIGDRLKHRPSELSGGQQQRVAIARALLTRPDVVFADEPTGNLDSASGTQVLRFLQRSARELGQTIVMVTHDPHAASFADRVVLLADGRLAGELSQPSQDDVLNALRALGE